MADLKPKSPLSGMNKIIGGMMLAAFAAGAAPVLIKGFLIVGSMAAIIAAVVMLIRIVLYRQR